MTTFSPPQIVSFPSSPLGPQMLLVARTDNGFATRFWKDDNVLPGGVANSWSDWQAWQFDPQNPPFDWIGVSFEGPLPPVPGWPLLGYVDQDGVYRANGFFAYADVLAPTGDPHVVVGQPWWQIPIADVAFDTFQKDFMPRVGAIWYNGPTPRLNIFGAAQFEAANLRELYWDGANWNWHDHDRGPDGDRLGPSSLVFPQPNHGYLFGVTAERDNIVLLAYQPTAADWNWADFHGPDGVTDLRAPVALTYEDKRGINVSVFTVGQLNNGEYHLFSVHQIFGKDWEGWQDYGRPPDEPPSPCEELPTPDVMPTRFLSGEAFSMTSACVALDDQGLHIHLFGHSDIMPVGDPSVEGGGAGSGALVHFSWEGGDWQTGSWAWQATTRPVECLSTSTRHSGQPGSRPPSRRPAAPSIRARQRTARRGDG